MKTVLYDEHKKLGAQVVDFAGWEMPLQYSGILREHAAVRNGVGIFDVSHMGVVHIAGKDAASFLDYLSTNYIEDRPIGSATYTVFCNEEGGCVDDVIVFRVGKEHFFVVVNASNREADLKHIQAYAKGCNVEVSDRFSDTGILAVQGPKSLSLIAAHFPEAAKLKFMQFTELNFYESKIFLSRTGYTGEIGFEIYGPKLAIASLWRKLLNDTEVVPCGLGARDLLRLEMGYALYGHEIKQDISPLESVAAWAVKMGKTAFVGKSSLEKIQRSPIKRNEIGIALEERAIPREGFQVFHNERKIGYVTSGSFSPTLKHPIAIALVDQMLSVNDKIDVMIRGNLYPAKVVKLPFINLKKDA